MSRIVNFDIPGALLAHLDNGASFEDLAAHRMVAVSTLKQKMRRVARGFAVRFLPEVEIRTANDIRRLKPALDQIKYWLGDLRAKETAKVKLWNSRELDCLSPKKMRWALYAEGILTLEELTAHYESGRLLLIPSIGRSAVVKINSLLSERGGVPCPADEKDNRATVV